MNQRLFSLADKHRWKIGGYKDYCKSCVNKFLAMSLVCESVQYNEIETKRQDSLFVLIVRIIFTQAWEYFT